MSELENTENIQTSTPTPTPKRKLRTGVLLGIIAVNIILAFVAGYVIAKFAVTNRPIRVYVALATVRPSPAPDPSEGVHVPCSYQFNNSLVMPGALVFALKSMPLAAVPITTLPVSSL